MLERRVDALHLRYRGALAKEVREELVTALAKAKELGGGALAVTLGPHTYAMGAKSREGWWYLENDLVRVTVDEGAYLDGWGLEVAARALTLAELGAPAALSLAADIANAMFGGIVDGERVGRIDVCADFAGFDVEHIDMRQWVTRGRSTPQRATPTPDDGAAEYYQARERIAFRIGRSDVVLRVYDKTVELRNDLVGEKRAAEHAAWRGAGWNGTDTVTRVEFQVRGDALKELDDGRLRDPSTVLERLDALWSYLTHKWARLGVIGSATRPSRWENDPRWTAVQAVTFASAADAPQRHRTRGSPRAKWTASIAMTYLAKNGALEEVEVPRAGEIARWGPRTARGFVRTTLGALLGVLGERLAEDLVAGGEIRAAQRLAEDIHAKRARAWRPPIELPKGLFKRKDEAA